MASKLVDPLIDPNSGPGFFGYIIKCLILDSTIWPRATRAEFLSFLSVFSLAIFCAVQSAEFFAPPLDTTVEDLRGDLLMIVCVLIGPTMLCVTIRRLHDSGRDGDELWILCFPGVGLLFLLWLCLIPSDMHDNVYGAHPKSRKPIKFDAELEHNVFT